MPIPKQRKQCNFVIARTAYPERSVPRPLYPKPTPLYCEIFRSTTHFGVGHEPFERLFRSLWIRILFGWRGWRGARLHCILLVCLIFEQLLVFVVNLSGLPNLAQRFYFLLKSPFMRLWKQLGSTIFATKTFWLPLLVHFWSRAAFLLSIGFYFAKNVVFKHPVDIFLEKLSEREALGRHSFGI